MALPGRESRFNEPPFIDTAELAHVIAARADRPYAIYGHSMGGRLAFEVVRELRRRGGALPSKLYLGASRAPDTLEPLAELSRVRDDELVSKLIELGGIPEEVAAEPELLELVLPVLRADFGWLDAYRYEAEPPIDVPIVAYAGAEDPSVSPEEILGWKRHTTASFDLQTEPGGHFFMHASRDRILAQVCADLT